MLSLTNSSLNARWFLVTIILSCLPASASAQVVYDGAVAFCLLPRFDYLDNRSGGNIDGKIGRVDVNACLSSVNPEQLQMGSSNELFHRACRTLFSDTNSPDAFRRMAGSDDLITKEEMRQNAFSRWYNLALRDSFSAFDTASGVGNPDGRIGFVDIEAVARDPQRFSFSAYQAAQLLKANPRRWERMAGEDGLVTRAELGR